MEEGLRLQHEQLTQQHESEVEEVREGTRLNMEKVSLIFG